MDMISKMKKFWSHKVDHKDIKAGDHLYVWSKYSHSSFFIHHGIVVGDNLVINVTGARVTDAKADKPINKHGCKVKGCAYALRNNTSVFHIFMDCFKNGKHVHRYRYGVGPFEHAVKFPGTCTMASSQPAEDDSVQTAKWMINQGGSKYVLPENNCEDFALYCKTNRWYGGNNKDKYEFRGTSSQVNGLRAFYVALSAGSFPGALTYDFNVPGNRLVRVTAATLAVSVLTYVRVRHVCDIGVRSDFVVESTKALLLRLHKDNPLGPNDNRNRLPPEEFKKLIDTFPDEGVVPEDLAERKKVFARAAAENSPPREK